MSLFRLLVLGHNNRQSFLFVSIFPGEEANRALTFLILRVADAALVVGRPTGRLHALVAVEIFHVLRAFFGRESDEVDFSLHHGADQ